MEDLIDDASIVKNDTSGPRVLFFGMECLFSTIVLQALIEGGIDVCAIVVPTQALPGRETPAITRRVMQSRGLAMATSADHIAQTTLSNLARYHTIPLWDAYRLNATETTDVLAAYHPDFICVACFSRKLPTSILRIPRLASLNVHPSLLPAHRGPVPLFWTLRSGEPAGVSIHLMDERFDTGAILLQEHVVVEDGIRYTQLEAQCATQGGALLVRAMAGIYAHTITPYTQDQTHISYESFPTIEDYKIAPCSHSTRHIYNFIRAVASAETPVELDLAGYSLFVIDAYSYRLYKDADVQEVTGSYISIPCRDGVVYVIAP